MKRFYEVNREQTKEFSYKDDNRQINHGHLRKIKDQMKESFGVMPPITINEQTKRVIDGQHRLQAFRDLVDSGELPKDATLSVMYISIDEDKEREAIVNANTVSKNWSLDDYVASYSKSNEVYKKLDEWCSTHTLCVDGNKKKYRYAAAMLKGVACSKSLKDGSFTITDDDFERGEIIHTELLEIIGVLDKPLKGSFYEYMAVAWSQVRHFHPFKEWLKELKIKKSTLSKKPFSNKEDWDNIFGLLHRAIDIKCE